MGMGALRRSSAFAVLALSSHLAGCIRTSAPEPFDIKAAVTPVDAGSYTKIQLSEGRPTSSEKVRLFIVGNFYDLRDSKSKDFFFSLLPAALPNNNSIYIMQPETENYISIVEAVDKTTFCTKKLPQFQGVSTGNSTPSLIDATIFATDLASRTAEIKRQPNDFCLIADKTSR